MKSLDYGSLTKEQKYLLDSAEEALELAYNPYSRFSVGAALRATSGAIIKGANFENASYGACICAERSALVSGNAQGIRQFRAIAIIGRLRQEGASDNNSVVSPCGICRQMLFETSQISEVDLEVIMATGDKSKAIVSSIQELLPLGFGPNSLGIDLAEFRHY